MSFPCRDADLFLAQNTFSEQSFRWMACQQEPLLFILLLAWLLPSAARQEQVWAWPCLVLQWGCSCPAAPGWDWGCVCAGRRQVLLLVVLKALQDADCHQSCVFLMPTKQGTQPENKVPTDRRLCLSVRYLKFFSFPLFLSIFFFLLFYIFGVVMFIPAGLFPCF